VQDGTGQIQVGIVPRRQVDQSVKRPE